MAVLVSGGAGYIGSHATLALLDAGEEVVIVDNLSTRTRSAVPAGARLVVANVGETTTVGRVIEAEKVDAIIHFAGSVVVPNSISNPLGYYFNNTVNSRALIEAAVRGGVRNFIFSSTAAVYGLAEANPVNEDAPLNPISPYGNSKMMTEIMLRDVAAAHDLRFVALRYFNVAGADPLGRTGQSTPHATHLVNVACQAALGLRTGVELYGTDYPTPDGTCIRDYIHVSDLAEAHLLALRYLRNGGTSAVLNCGYGRGRSVREVVETVRLVSGNDFEVRLAARRPGDPAELVADAQRIRLVLGWRPRYDDLDRIVADVLAWEKICLARANKSISC